MKNVERRMYNEECIMKNGDYVPRLEASRGSSSKKTNFYSSFYIYHS